jgi:1,2-phenylacetyl-CoA epoxidase catalytic subunit
MDREFSTHGREEECLQDFGGKSEKKKRQLRRPKCMWEDIIIIRWILEK